METNLIILISLCAFFLVLVTIFKCIEGVHKEKTKISFKEGLDLTQLPVVTFYHKDLKLHFLLDTGSNISYIDSSILDTVEAEDSNEVSNTIGVEGSGVKTHHYNIEIYYKNQIYKEKFGAVDLSSAFSTIEKESGIRLHGILGSNFFERYKYILDFKELTAYKG